MMGGGGSRSQIRLEPNPCFNQASGIQVLTQAFNVSVVCFGYNKKYLRRLLRQCISRKKVI